MSYTEALKPPFLITSPNHSEETDNTLAERGDAESFVLLYHRYAPTVYRYLYVRTHSHHDAEEATARVFERAWQSFHRFRPTGAFAGWLFTIVQRVLIDHYRTISSQRAATAPFDDTISDLRDQPEEAVLRDEQRLALIREIGRLSPEHQDIIYLRFVAELPYAAIATTVGKSEAAVKMMLYRALEVLKRRINHE
jgi:RNA polymerase sigma-70 factor (ECF subfamily)